MKLYLYLVLIGLAMGVGGFQNYKLASKSSATPVSVELRNLEENQPVTNVYVQLGEHVKIYSESIFWYQKTKGAADPLKTDRVDYTFYPIVSYGNSATNFRVLVKTGAFKTVGDIPEKSVIASSITGLVINEIRSLSDKERGLLAEGFPNKDLSRILILEENRTPETRGTALVWLLSGCTLVGFGLFKIIKGRASD